MNPYRECNSWQELIALCAETGKGMCGGWMCGPTESELIFQYAKKLPRGARTVEIGVYGGPNLSIFALVGDELEVIGIDDWSNDTEPDLRAFCIANLEKSGILDRVRLVEQSSHVVGPTWGLPIDFLIIDGDHTREGALQDLCDFSKWVKPGGYLMMDDVDSMTQVEEAFDRWLAAEPVGAWEMVFRQGRRQSDTSPLIAKAVLLRRA